MFFALNGFYVYPLGRVLFAMLLCVLLFVCFEGFDDFGDERVADDVFFGEVYEGYSFDSFEDVHSFYEAGVLSVWKVYLGGVAGYDEFGVISHTG